MLLRVCVGVCVCGGECMFDKSQEISRESHCFGIHTLHTVVVYGCTLRLSRKVGGLSEKKISHPEKTNRVLSLRYL